jgi:hypothetical protein
MTRDPEHPETEHPESERGARDPTTDPDHPLADAGRPVSEAEARKNRDQDPPA